MKKTSIAAVITILGCMLMPSNLTYAMVTSDMDYGEGYYTENYDVWNSEANGQFGISNNQQVTFLFDSRAKGEDPEYGWVAEITDGVNYFTTTQGEDSWTYGDEWNNLFQFGDGTWNIEKNWTDTAEYTDAMTSANVTLKISRVNEQVVFDSQAVGKNGKTYTKKVTVDFPDAPYGDLYLQVGSNHGSMTLYSVKYSASGESTEETTKEKVTLKPSMDPSKGMVTVNEKGEIEDETEKKSSSRNEESSVSQDGIEVQLDSDQEKYDRDDTIKLILDIKNRSGIDIYDVNVHTEMPDEIDAEFKGEKQFDCVEADEAVQVLISASMENEEQEEEIPFLLIGGIVAAVLLIVIILIIILVKKGKKKNNNQFVSYIIILTLLGAGFSPFAARAEGLKKEPANSEVREMVVTKTVEIEGEETKLSIRVSYTGTIRYSEEELERLQDLLGTTDGASAKTEIPNVVGKSEEEAIQDLQDAHLGYKISSDYHNTIPKGYVISQSEESGSIVDKNTTVEIVVSQGAKKNKMPDVIGKNKEEARKLLEGEDYGLVVTFEYQTSDKYPANYVIGTSCDPKTDVYFGDSVVLYVSQGFDTSDAVVPSLAGLSQEKAKAVLEGMGLQMKVEEESYSDTVAAGNIISQDIKDGKKVPKGTTIGVIVSKGGKSK